MWMNTLATLEVPSSCEMKGCEQPSAVFAAYAPDLEDLDRWTPGAHVQLQVAWGCDGHADAVAGGRSQWRLLGECKPPQGDRCEDSATHVAIMTETDKNTIVSANSARPTRLRSSSSAWTQSSRTIRLATDREV